MCQLLVIVDYCFTANFSISSHFHLHSLSSIVLSVISLYNACGLITLDYWYNKIILLFDDLVDDDEVNVFPFPVMPNTTKSRPAGPATYNITPNT